MKTEAYSNALAKATKLLEEKKIEEAEATVLALVAALNKRPSRGTSKSTVDQLSSIQASALFLAGNIASRKSEIDRALENYFHALQIHEQGDYLLGIGIVSGQISNLYNARSDYKNALLYALKARDAFELVEDEKRLGTVWSNIGAIYAGMGLFSKSLESWLKSRPLLERVGDDEGLARLLGNVGSVYFYMGDKQSAFQYFCDCRDRYEELGLLERAAQFDSRIGALLTHGGEFERAIGYYLRALVVQESESVELVLSETLLNLAESYYKLGRYSEAIEKYDKVLTLSVKSDCHRNVALSKSGLASVLASKEYSRRDTKKAISLYLESIEMLEKLEEYRYLSTVYKQLADLYEELNRWKMFASHIRKYYQNENKLKNNENEKALAKYEMQTALAEQEKHLAVERERYEAKLAEAQRELQMRSKELETTISQVVDKNSFLQNISINLHKILKMKSHDVPEGIEQIITSIQRHMSSGAVSQMIYGELQAVHGEFMARLAAKHISLSSTELRIAALLKMKLTSSNIAALLFTSKRTVEVHRYRLRKKMGLSTKDNLYMILTEI